MGLVGKECCAGCSSCSSPQLRQNMYPQTPITHSPTHPPTPDVAPLTALTSLARNDRTPFKGSVEQMWEAEAAAVPGRQLGLQHLEFARCSLNEVPEAVSSLVHLTCLAFYDDFLQGGGWQHLTLLKQLRALILLSDFMFKEVRPAACLSVCASAFRSRYIHLLLAPAANKCFFQSCLPPPDIQLLFSFAADTRGDF